MRFKNKIAHFSLLFILLVLMGSCRVYKQDVMFQFDDNFTESDLTLAVETARTNYLIKPNDWLRIDVFTNGGERIIDPNFELVQNINPQALQNANPFQYLVQNDGRVKLPLLGLVSLQGLSIQQAEDKLEKLYNSSYQESFVKLRYTNKRVTVLGATGGQVIPLLNENTSVVEAIALAGGMPAQGKAQNIRLIRGYGTGNIEVFKLNLSKISTMKEGLQLVQENDIIYIEPWKRPVNQALRDISPVLSVISSILALVLIVQNINQ